MRVPPAEPAAALKPVARNTYDWYLNSPFPATRGSAVMPSSSIGRTPGSTSDVAGTGCTSARNVISNEARLALRSSGSVTVAFHCRLPVASSTR